jgi:hypothetical protein
MALKPRVRGFRPSGSWAALKAARDFGLDPDVADSIAARFDPRRHDLDRIIDALAVALLIEGAVEVPDAV